MPLATDFKLSDDVGNQGQFLMERNPVECLSGHTYADRPIALWWQGERIDIARIDARWRIPGEHYFRVHTENDLLFELCYIEQEDAWTISHIGD